MIRRTFYILLVTVLLGGLGGAIAWWSFYGLPGMIAEGMKSAPPPVQTVSAEAAKSETWQPEIDAIGTLAAAEGIDITPQVGGIVEEINFNSGQDVKKGQLLVKLSSETDEAELRSTLAQLDNAQDELTRREGLMAKGFAAQTEVSLLRATRNKLQANADQTRAEIAQKSIYAPWDGHVGLREISLGSYLAPGQKIVWLQKVNPIYADFTVTEADFGRVKEGLPVTAKFNAWPDESFKGTIVTTDARMSDATRMITVRAKFDNPGPKLLPGMYANVVVDAGTPKSVVTVPQTAVTFSLYGDNVFVVVKASKSDPKAKAEELAIERRFVKAGKSRDGRIEIVQGLQPGDQVVTAGHNKIDQGSRVVINNSIALKAADRTTIQ